MASFISASIDENAYAEDTESYLAAEERKRKGMAKIVKAEKANAIIRR
jgi:hypothetical protein